MPTSKAKKDAIKLSKKKEKAENKPVDTTWRSVLRLERDQADRLKAAVASLNEKREPGDKVSINSAIGIIIGIWLTEEGF